MTVKLKKQRGERKRSMKSKVGSGAQRATPSIKTYAVTGISIVAVEAGFLTKKRSKAGCPQISRNTVLCSGSTDIQEQVGLRPPCGLTFILTWVGKTYLASVIIDACREHSNGKTCYFYCNEKVETKSSGLSVLRGILLQLIPKDEDLVPYCLSKKRSSHTSNISDLSTAQTLIETFCERLPRLNMVIDGLDECEYARKELLETFKNLIKKAEDSSPGKLRVLFLSRPLPEIRSAIPNASVIALEPANTMGDIRSYCQQRRTRELEKFQSEERLINDAVDTICIKSHGTLKKASNSTNLIRL